MERLFSVDEANALVPQLSELLQRLRDAHGALRGATLNARRQAASNGGAPEPLIESGGEYMQLISEINELGVIVRDPESGLCDFPAERDGEAVYLCWQLGEERVAFWHPQDTGIAGRQPL